MNNTRHARALQGQRALRRMSCDAPDGIELSLKRSLPVSADVAADGEPLDYNPVLLDAAIRPWAARARKTGMTSDRPFDTEEEQR